MAKKTENTRVYLEMLSKEIGLGLALFKASWWLLRQAETINSQESQDQRSLDLFLP